MSKVVYWGRGFCFRPGVHRSLLVGIAVTYRPDGVSYGEGNIWFKQGRGKWIGVRMVCGDCLNER